MRIAFFDCLELRPPLVRHNRFAGLCEVLRDAGHDAVLVDAPLRGDIAIVAGASRERDVAPLIAATALVDVTRSAQADVAIFPLRGGLAHGVLMARACGEWDRPLRVVLWGDAPSRKRFLDDWASDGSLAPIVADAMERSCVALADAIVLPDNLRRNEVLALGAATAHTSVAALSANGGMQAASGERIVFANVSGHRAEWLALADGAERLAAAGHLAGKEIVFAWVGSKDPRDSTEIMRLRAQRWSFAHRIVRVQSASDLRALHDGRTQVVIATHDVEDVPPNIVALRGVTTVLLRGAPHEAGRAIEQAVLSPTPSVSLDVAGWMEVLTSSVKPTLQNTGNKTPSLSVCILHHERPKMLEAAVRSVGDAASEVIVLDNASRSAEAIAALSELEANGVRVVRFDAPKPFAKIYNTGARSAQGDFVAFLDDDNLFAIDGLTRLLRACATGAFDVVTSDLDLFDTNENATTARMAFIGPAHTAGLFFNAFGDTCMAFRREAFLALGGFREFAGPYPAADWLLLARAQEAGLKIGVLQEPAFRYRRHATSAALAWQKADRAGARALVRDAYGDRVDAQMLAKLSQEFWLSGE